VLRPLAQTETPWRGETDEEGGERNDGTRERRGNGAPHTGDVHASRLMAWQQTSGRAEPPIRNRRGRGIDAVQAASRPVAASLHALLPSPFCFFSLAVPAGLLSLLPRLASPRLAYLSASAVAFKFTAPRSAEQRPQDGRAEATWKEPDEEQRQREQEKLYERVAASRDGDQNCSQGGRSKKCISPAC
jgi:hypothetical protein